jgi:hypothetical protein
MSRKDRKRARKRKSIPQEEFEGITKAELWMLAGKLATMPRDKSKDNITFFDGRSGCYNLVGTKVYCSECFWKERNCQKRRNYHEQGRAELDER